MERVWGRLKRVWGCAHGRQERRESGDDFKASNLGGVQGRYLNTPLALSSTGTVAFQEVKLLGIRKGM